MMKIEQNKYSDHYVFTFEPNHLNFAFKEKAGSGDIDVPYAEFPLKSITRIIENQWLRNVGYLWLVLGAIQIVYSLFSEGLKAGVGFWAVLGAGCVLWAHFTKAKYTVYSPEQGAVWIIQDKKTHDQIIEEITTRRKKQLLDWYGSINFVNSVEREVSKFNWLVDQKALTRDEADKLIAEVKAHHDSLNNTAPPMLLN